MAAVRVQPGTAKLGRAGLIVLSAGAILGGISNILQGLTLRSYNHALLTRSAGDPLPDAPSAAALFSLFSFVLIGAALTGTVCMIMWTYRNAKVAKALGIPSSLTPGWAIGGWFIPVGSLFLPCMSIAGSVPREHRARVVRWWLVYVFASLMAFPITVCVIVAYFTDSSIPLMVAGALFAIQLVLLALQLAWGLHLTTLIESTHRELSGQRAA